MSNQKREISIDKNLFINIINHIIYLFSIPSKYKGSTEEIHRLTKFKKRQLINLYCLFYSSRILT